MDMPLVSVVIATWNRKDDVLVTIQSIFDQEYAAVEIVIVDNGSSDGTAEAVASLYPQVRLVALPENRGASEGRNAGIRVATGEFIFLLDSDASMGHDSISSVVARLQQDPSIGAVACKVVNYYTGQLDRTAGWVFSERIKSRQDEEFLCFNVSECGSVFRRSALEQAGLFWNYLFFGREGEELCLRIWDSGHSILYFPSSKVYHRVSPNKRIAGGSRAANDTRNILAIYLVRYTWWMLLIFIPLKLFSTVLKSIGNGWIGAMFKAFADLGKDLPYLLSKRQPIRDETARHYLQLQRDHGALSWDLRSWLQHKANLPVSKFSQLLPRRMRGL